MQTAIFLDRDGVIVENRSDYIRSWNDVVFVHSALSALNLISQNRMKIIIITNQSIIGRNLISFKQAMEINYRICEKIALHHGKIDGIYMCPHAPDDFCPCRKPLPGMVHQAAEDYLLDLEHSIFIGDTLSDIQAGKSAGIRKTVLVKTGLWSDQINKPAGPAQPFLVSEDLLDAINHLFPDL